MATVGTAELDLEINRAKLERDISASGRKVETELTQAGKKGAEGIRSQLGGALTAATGLYATAKIGGFFEDAVTGASDLNEQITKGQAIFGAYASEVDAFAQSAEKIGQSRKEALQATGVFGNLFTAVGITGQKAAEMSIKFDKLGSDLASFNNTSPQEALDALRSGLVGEVEPLRRFGVNLNEVALKQKALELGLSDGKSVLDANAKAQAAYALILEQTKTAQGDFERTSDGLANKQRILAAEYQNAKDRLGSGLLPVQKELVSVAGATLGVFEKLPQPIQTGTVALGGLVTVVGLLGPTLKTGVSLLGDLGSKAIEAGRDLIVPKSAIDGLGSSAEVNAGKVGLFRRELSEVGTGTKIAAGLAAAVTSFELTTKALNSLADAQTKVKGGEDLVAGLELLGTTGEKTAVTAEAIDRVADSVERLNKSTVGKIFDSRLPQASQKEITNFNNALVELVESGKAEQAKKAYGQIALALINDGLSAQQVARRFQLYFAALDTADVKSRTAAAGVDKHKKALKDLEDQVAKSTDLFDARQSAASAERDVRDAATELADAQRAATVGSKELTDAQRQITDAEHGVVEAHRAVADAERGVVDAQRTAREAQQALTQARKDAAEQLEDLRFAAEGAALSEERAADRLAEARKKAQNAADDPRTTANEARDAVLSLAEADLAYRQAQDQRGDSQQALADAERRGIEGAPQVVAAKQAVADAERGVSDAKQRVTDATYAEGQAEQRVTDAYAAAAATQVDLREKVQVATENLHEKQLEEIQAHAEIAEKLYGAQGALVIYQTELDRLTQKLDPNSPLRQNLEGLAEDLNLIPGGPASTPIITDPYGTDLPKPGNPQTGNYPGRGRSGLKAGGDTYITNNANVTQTNPSSSDIADALLWEVRHGG